MQSRSFAAASSPLDVALSRLQGVRRRGKLILALCPAHGDRNPSLSVQEMPGGFVGLKCFTGCSRAAILAAMALEPSDLRPARDPDEVAAHVAKRAAQRRRFASASKEGKRAIFAATLRAHLERERDSAADHDPGFMRDLSPLRSASVNAARARAAEDLGISVPARRTYRWESSGHDTDPDWPWLFGRALTLAGREGCPKRLLDARAVEIANATLRGAWWPERWWL